MTTIPETTRDLQAFYAEQQHRYHVDQVFHARVSAARGALHSLRDERSPRRHTRDTEAVIFAIAFDELATKQGGPRPVPVAAALQLVTDALGISSGHGDCVHALDTYRQCVHCDASYVVNALALALPEVIG